MYSIAFVVASTDYKPVESHCLPAETYGVAAKHNECLSSPKDLSGGAVWGTNDQSTELLLQ